MNEFEKIVEAIENEWEINTFKTIVEKEIPEQRFIVDGIIPTESICVLSGNPGLGKTWLLLQLCLDVSEGKNFLEKFPTKKTRVLLVDEERSQKETQRRLNLLGVKESDVLITNLQGIRIDIEENIDKLLKICEENGIGFIVFDSLRAMNTLNENDSKDSQIILNALKKFVRKGIGVLLSHHNRKETFMASKEPGQALRGSTALSGGITSHISLDKAELTKEGTELYLSHAKMNEGERIKPFRALFKELEGKITIEYLGEVEDEANKIGKAKEAILKLLAEKEMFNKEIVVALIPLYFAERTIIRAINELKEDEEVLIRKEGTKIFYNVKK